MKLKGKRVLLSRPVLEKSAIELTPEVQAKLDQENMKKWTHLEVFAIGDQVTDINVGDVVYLPKNAIEQCDILEVDGEVKLMTSDFQIAIVW
jgi:uncharacterized ferritin-like protein (DUF455 family)